MREEQRYQVTQSGKDYILTTIVTNDKLRIECKELMNAAAPLYSTDCTYDELLSRSNLFAYTSSLLDVQNELNNAIENQLVSINNQYNLIDVIFTLRKNSITQMVPFQLYPYSQKTIRLSNTMSNPLMIVNEQKAPYHQTAPSPGQDDFPDCTYSTKANNPIHTYQNYPITTTTSSSYNNVLMTPSSPGCGCPQDHDRINKIEMDHSLLKGDHKQLIERLNNLKGLIDYLIQQTNNLKKENGILSMKTLELKRIYRDLLDAEAALMLENDELKKERHELILKKNELGFYMNDHHDHDTVKEVNVPYEVKRRRPTNVSKKEKQFGGGGGYSSLPQNKGYTSTISKSQANNNINDFM